MDLLLLACSRTKRMDERLIPAIDRYDGPFWRTLRNQLTIGQLDLVDRLDVFALSAEFGVIPAIQPIPNYDRQLDAVRARTLREQRLGFAVLAQRASYQGYSRVLIAGGHQYQAILPAEVLASLRLNGHVTRTTGRIGQQLAQLKHWLRG